jgi:hypothetical protein
VAFFEGGSRPNLDGAIGMKVFTPKGGKESRIAGGNCGDAEFNLGEVERMEGTEGKARGTALFEEGRIGLVGSLLTGDARLDGAPVDRIREFVGRWHDVPCGVRGADVGIKFHWVVTGQRRESRTAGLRREWWRRG